MSNTLPPDLRDLHAYVDDQLDSSVRHKVESRLEQDAESQQRLRDYEVLGSMLKDLYDPVLAEPVPPYLEPPGGRRRRIRPIGAIAASLLLLICGAWIGIVMHESGLLPESEPSYVVHEAANVYNVYTPEVQHPVEVKADQKEHLVSWLSRRLGTSVQVPDLIESGYEFIGGRLLATEYGLGAMFMYEESNGERIVLYMCKYAETKSTSFRFAEHENVSVSYWFDGSFSYAVAGELPRNKLIELSKKVYPVISG